MCNETGQNDYKSYPSKEEIQRQMEYGRNAKQKVYKEMVIVMDRTTEELRQRANTVGKTILEINNRINWRCR